MTIKFDTTDFVRTINFYKKQDNWVEILDTAAHNVANSILVSAKNKAYQSVKKNTGRLGDSIGIKVSSFGNTVDITLGSSHPAAAIIEYGGYSPFPPWGEESGLDFPVAKKIYENQPFAQPRPYLRPAIEEGAGLIEGEVIRVAHRLKP